MPVDDRIGRIWCANQIIIVIDLPLLPMPFLRHSRFFTQESAMGQMMSSRVSQPHGRFTIPKSIGREDYSELLAKVFLAIAGIHKTRPSHGSGERATCAHGRRGVAI